MHSQIHIKIVLFSKMCRLALESTQPLIQGVPGLFPRGWRPATYVYLVLRLRMSGGILLFPLQAYMV